MSRLALPFALAVTCACAPDLSPSDAAPLARRYDAPAVLPLLSGHAAPERHVPRNPRVSHARARALLERALERRLGRAPTLAELQAVQAVTWLETRYGMAWRGEGRGSNNWGAVHDHNCSPDAFDYDDSRTNGDTYSACFRRYDSPAAGAGDVARILVRTHALEVAPDKLAFLRELRDAGYYQASLAVYGDAFDRALVTIASALDEPVALD